MTGLEWMLVCLPLGFAGQLTLHEGSHAAVAIAGGRKVEISLLPKRLPDRFTWGRTSVLGPPLAPGFALLIYTAPRITNLVELALLPFLHPRDDPVGGLILAFMLCAAVDFIFNTLGIFASSRANDAWSSYIIGAPPVSLATFRVLSCAASGSVLGLAAWRIAGAGGLLGP